jgi:hypothetical protein
MEGYRYEATVTLAASASQLVQPPLRAGVEKMSVFAVSQQPVTATFAPQINGQALGSSTTVTGRLAADLVYSNDAVVFPSVPQTVPSNPAALPVPQPQFGVLVSNGGGAAATVRLVFTGIAHPGA